MPVHQDPKDDHKVDIALIKHKLEVIDERLTGLITRIEFTPIKLIVYGLCASILTGVIGALLTKVLTK